MNTDSNFEKPANPTPMSLTKYLYVIKDLTQSTFSLDSQTARRK